mmetsp:Transcript_38106/g.38792  ORF Transcript_38106/g.38792 Transcript_38106/m.38792 type:complete len:355 (+) Transcript_38106:77-1141(+)
MRLAFILYQLHIICYGTTIKADDEVILSGKHQKVGAIDVIWQTSTSEPVGVIFLAHGCAHSATDWFPQSISCPTCIGLPVEMTIVSEVLKRGYVAVASSSIDRMKKCWTNNDVQHVASVLEHIYSTLKLDKYKVPLYGLGASSGGYFVSMFSNQASQFGFKVSAICMQISALFTPDPTTPPVIFVHMAKDRLLAIHINDLVDKLVKLGVPAEQYPCRPKVITDTYFYDHYHALSLSESLSLVHQLKDVGMISKSSGLLSVDPLLRDWVPHAEKALPGHTDPLINDISPVFELMKLAWAEHEITSDFLTETFDFFRRNRPETAIPIPDKYLIREREKESDSAVQERERERERNKK